MSYYLYTVVLIVYIVCGCLNIHDVQANSSQPHGVKNILLIGTGVNSVSYSTRQWLQNYHVIQRAKLPNKEIKKLAQLSKAEYILVSNGKSLNLYGKDGQYINVIESMNSVSKKPAIHVPKPMGGKSKQIYPGMNVPEYVFPGKSKYSYLFGEGDNSVRQFNYMAHNPVYHRSVQAIREFAGIHQNNNQNPFWRQNNIIPNQNLNNFTQLGDLPNNTSARVRDVISLGTHVGTYGLGVGSVMLDAHYDYKNLQAKYYFNKVHQRGTPIIYNY